MIDEAGAVLGPMLSSVETNARQPYKRMARVLWRLSYAYPIVGFIPVGGFADRLLLASVCKPGRRLEEKAWKSTGSDLESE